MNVDMFGRFDGHIKSDSSGNFDIQNKRLVNVHEPIEATDAVNLKYLFEQRAVEEKKCLEKLKLCDEKLSEIVRHVNIIIPKVVKLDESIDRRTLDIIAVLKQLEKHMASTRMFTRFF